MKIYIKEKINNISQRKAAMAVGIAFITSVVIVTIVDDFLLANFVIPGDSATLALDIEANSNLFVLAVLGYFLVLMLDSVIGISLYVVLKAANEKFAFLTAIFRLLYVLTLIFGLIALALRVIDVYSYGTIKLLGYIFFAVHIFILGYTVLISRYIPKILGAFLIFVSFTYITFFVDFKFPEIIKIITMLTMFVGEFSLSLWLLLRKDKIPEIKSLN